MPRVSAQELADLVPCPLADVARIEALGLLSRGEDDGLYPPSDVHVARLMAAFEEAGVRLEDVAKGVRAGDFSFPLGLVLPDPEPRRETFEDLGARLERSPSSFGVSVASSDCPPRGTIVFETRTVPRSSFS